MSGKWILKCIGFAALTVLGIFAFGYLFMLLWNALLPELFGLHAITFWQGVGLLVLGKMLFGGFRSGWGRGRCHCGYGWKNRWQEKMMNMSPEEREKFKQRMKEKCGYYYGKEEDHTAETKA
jgi:Ca2+/H+ antiporter, TMEM165/GDT1 family